MPIRNQIVTFNIRHFNSDKVVHDFERLINDAMGRDSAVGIATRYGLDGPGVEFWWGQDFPYPPRPALGPTQPPIQ
jgi:hypothetical protein